MWYRLSLPGRPNGQRGWVRADQVEVKPAKNRIVVYRAARRIEVRRIADNAGCSARRSRSDPGGGDAARAQLLRPVSLRPTNSFLGTFALETSAYSKLSDWPGGGIVGIHGRPPRSSSARPSPMAACACTTGTANALRSLRRPGRRSTSSRSGREGERPGRESPPGGGDRPRTRILVRRAGSERRPAAPGPPRHHDALEAVREPVAGGPPAVPALGDRHGGPRHDSREGRPAR